MRRLLPLAALLVTAIPLQAQHHNPGLREVRHSRQQARGPWYGFVGVGMGNEAYADLTTPAIYGQSRLRPTLSLGGGATLGQSFRLGVEGFGWFNIADGGVLETVTTVMLAGRVYPLETSGLYLKAGGGFGAYRQEYLDEPCGCSGPIVSDYGFAWSVGGGYEMPLGGGAWLGPTVELVRMDVTGPGGYRERVLNVGLSITFDGHD